jgi:hypothetical protein
VWCVVRGVRGAGRVQGAWQLGGGGRGGEHVPSARRQRRWGEAGRSGWPREAGGHVARCAAAALRCALPEAAAFLPA